jgi:hypothetical protein
MKRLENVHLHTLMINLRAGKECMRMTSPLQVTSPAHPLSSMKSSSSLYYDMCARRPLSSLRLTHHGEYSTMSAHARPCELLTRSIIIIAIRLEIIVLIY